MQVGYARTSTEDQDAGLDAQIRELNEVGCERVYNEKESSIRERPELEEALRFVRQGDTFVITKLDRLARSITHLMQLVERLQEKGVALRILNMGVDTSTATGKLILTVLGGIAQFEREIMLERQKEGIAKARREGKYLGRMPTARMKTPEIWDLRDQGIGATEIAKRLGIARKSVYRVLERER